MSDAGEGFEYFPYEELRPHQREFIDLVAEAVKNGENAIIEAPTGFGKTVSVLAGILPHAKEMGYKVLYLARTHRQMDRVIEELKAINRKSPVSGVELRSRKDLCLHTYLTQFTSDAYTAMVVCKNLKKLGKCEFYENEKKKKTEFDELVKFFLGEPSHPAEILNYAETLELCPYDLTRRVAEKADVIVASYLYLLSPSIRENFMSSLDVDYSDLIVVFDEAHNLPDQAISALSDRISIHTVNRAIKEADEYNEHEIANFLSVFGRGLEILFQEILFDKLCQLIDVHAAQVLLVNGDQLGIGEEFCITFLIVEHRVDLADTFQGKGFNQFFPAENLLIRARVPAQQGQKVAQGPGDKAFVPVKLN